MTFRSGPLRNYAVFFCIALALAALSAPASAVTKKKVAATNKKPAHSQPAATHGKKAITTSRKTAATSRTSRSVPSKRGNVVVVSRGKAGKKTRIPRTLRTVPVSPVVRENAADRVEQTLTETSSSPFIFPNSLHAFFKALHAEQSNRNPSQGDLSPGTVRILQFGDSHTAADIFTGDMRSHMQQQFGDGGLGFQFPGHPFAGYHIVGSLRSQSEGWLTEGNHFLQLGDGDLGLGGISISTSQPGQSITLETTCTTLQLHFLQQPGGGKLQFTDNGTAISDIDTNTDGASRAGTFTYSCTAGQHDFAFTTLERAPVKLLGIVTEQPGVTYECLGINGAVAPLMLRWNQSLFADYLRQRDPALIVLAYGTNEASGSSDRLETYQADFERLLDNLHRITPGASILVLGPEDRSIASHRSWRPFAGIDRIIAFQKEACRLHGCTYWDTRRRMGGFGSMQQWVAAGWAQPDRTHLTGTGYRALAGALYTDLMHAYNLYEQHSDTAVEESRNGKAPRNY